MKKAPLLALALIAAACADAEQSETPSEGSEQVTELAQLRALAEQGDPIAQNNLGVMYDDGDGMPEDDAEAVRWYRLATEQGNARAQYNLGLMYAYGEGVPENNVLAYMWMNLAAAQGDETAQSNKDILERRMTREQIAEAQRLSREWIEAHPPGGN